MPPATDSIRAFLDYLSHEAAASPLTIETYQSDLRSFTAYAEERLGEPLVPPRATSTWCVAGYRSSSMRD